jgi:hypothetical protein
MPCGEAAPPSESLLCVALLTTNSHPRVSTQELWISHDNGLARISWATELSSHQLPAICTIILWEPPSKSHSAGQEHGVLPPRISITGSTRGHFCTYQLIGQPSKSGQICRPPSHTGSACTDGILALAEEISELAVLDASQACAVRNRRPNATAHG